MKTNEHAEQRLFVAWLRAHRILFASLANGAHLAGDARRRAMQMNKLKSTGLWVGAPDLFIVSPVPGHPEKRCFVEMKAAKGGRLSLLQAETHEVLRANGDIVLVAHGADDAIDALRGLGFGR